jgi:hypothetical protein
MSLLSWLTGILSGNGSKTENTDMDEFSADDGGMQWWEQVGIAQWLVLEDNEDEDDELREDT